MGAVQPAGLNNLGATCYLNTLLQTLFHCLPFRAAVYAFPELPAGRGGSSGGESGDSGGGGAVERCPGAAVVRELQRLFAHLDAGGAGQWGDTAALVALLGFDTGYQQDPIECWKLLSATVEEAFKATGDPALGRLFDREFRGRQKYTTRCAACGRASEREEVLEELQLQIKGRGTVRGIARGALVRAAVLDINHNIKRAAKTCERVKVFDYSLSFHFVVLTG